MPYFPSGAAANALTGTTIASNVVASSLTSVGTITALIAKNEVINNNTVALPAPIAGTILQLGQADATANRMYMDAFAGNNVFSFRQAQGTAASPSASTSASNLGIISGFGYGQTAYTTNARAQIFFIASETWTDSAQGTYFAFTTTTTGTTTTAEAVRINNSGGFSIGTTSDPGIGAIYTNSATFMIRTKTSYTDGAAVSVGTLTNAPTAGNPTKWIAIDDNGTTRKIPAW